MISERTELGQIIDRLKLMSHAPAQSYDFAPPLQSGTAWRTGIDQALIPRRRAVKPSHGTKTPTGGIDRAGDWARVTDGLPNHYGQKSAGYFQKRLQSVHSDRALTELLAEARAVLRAWTHTPPQPTSIEPERGSFFWKCQIADSDETMAEIVRLYLVSRTTVYNYRARYRHLRK